MDQQHENALAADTSPSNPDPASMRCADLADAAEKLTGRRSHMSSAIQMIEGGPLRGSALTLSLVRDQNTPAMVLGLAVVRVIEDEC